MTKYLFGDFLSPPWTFDLSAIHSSNAQSYARQVSRSYRTWFKSPCRTADL